MESHVRKPGQKSEVIFTATELRVPKIIRNRILRMMASLCMLLILPPLWHRQGNLKFQWTRKYMTRDMRCVLFTDEKSATLDGPDGLVNPWFFFGDERHQNLQCQQ